MEDMRKDMVDTNIVNKFNSDLLTDPNQNFNILHDLKWPEITKRQTYAR